MIVSGPGDRLPTIKPEQVEYPVLIFAAAAAAELCIELDVLHGQSLGDRVRADLLDCPHLAGAHHLVLVEQEYRHSRRIQQFIDLGTSGPLPGWSEPVRGYFPDPVRFVADQNV